MSTVKDIPKKVYVCAKKHPHGDKIIFNVLGTIYFEIYESHHLGLHSPFSFPDRIEKRDSILYL